MAKLADLQGQVAAVTGAAGGICGEMARVFYRAGANVLLVDVDQEALGKAERGFNDPERVAMFRADVTDSGQMEQMVAEAVQRWGRLDVFVSGGAHALYSSPIAETGDEAWHRVIAVHLHGQFNGIRAAARQMLQQKSGGKIICMSSPASWAPLTSVAGYCCAKAAVNMLVKVAAQELGVHNIRVNALAPGTTYTRTTSAFLDIPGRSDVTAREFPLGRLARPIDIANAALFLASDQAEFITGAVLPVDGGQGLGGRYSRPSS